MLLMAVIWPVSAFFIGDAQLAVAENLTSVTREIYLPTILIQLFVLGMVSLAMRSEDATPRSVGLSGFNPWSPFIGVGFLIAANVVLLTIQTLILSQSPTSISDVTPLLPSTLAERLVWTLLCLVVSVSEEVTFRGYLITRLTLLFRGRLWIGVILSTMAFASGHLYQGIGGFILIFVYGLMFAGLYFRTQSLYPGIVAHFLQDFAAMFLKQ